MIFIIISRNHLHPSICCFLLLLVADTGLEQISLKKLNGAFCPLSPSSNEENEDQCLCFGQHLLSHTCRLEKAKL